MKEHFATAMNLVLAADLEAGTLRPMAEVVVIVSEPRYQIVEGEIVRERVVEEYRFLASPSVLRATAKDYLEFADAAEEAARSASGGLPGQASAGRSA